MIHILIVDDDNLSREALKSVLKNYDRIQIKGEASCSLDAIEFLKTNSDIDLIFLDIEMDGGSGFELADYIDKEYPDIIYIFLTGHAEFALDGYKYEPLDFLSKPINALRFDQAMRRVFNKKEADNDQNSELNRIGVYVDGGCEIINIKDICYIERKLRKIYLKTKTRTMVLSKYSMEQLEIMFSNYDFIRVYPSFIVPLKHIRSIFEEGDRVYHIILDNTSEKIPLSRSKYKRVKEYLSKEGIKFY